MVCGKDQKKHHLIAANATRCVDIADATPSQETTCSEGKVNYHNSRGKAMCSPIIIFCFIKPS